MYSMVMMMAVASSGDVSSFGGNKGGCCGGTTHAGLFAKHSTGCCGGGGLFSGLKEKWAHKKHSCHGAEPAPCDTCGAPIVSPCGTPEPCATPGPVVTPTTPTTPPKTMPAPIEPAKKKES